MGTVVVVEVLGGVVGVGTVVAGDVDGVEGVKGVAPGPTLSP